jgi:hypothetical protein
MSKHWRILILIGLTICYLSGPFVAGALRIGDRAGPALYPKSLHSGIYIVAHEVSHNEKPREPLDGWLYRRPLFYGLSRRLKSQNDRQEYIEMARRNESPRLPQLIEMNEKVDRAPSR